VRRPGYGDFLVERDPDLRRRQAEDGVPEGFADAVAWLVDTGDAAIAPCWSVTFAVDDTDAVVARATELGADVVSPVTDLGVVRVATLRDPHGAYFIVSRYQPG
jgi:predicted enzyme related to lactoylglutathione lyase